jgi:prepilin-type N-terminal cleavage/methylation domain-containing protein
MKMKKSGKMKKSRKAIKGFSLVEMMLVMVIISSILYMGAGYLRQRALQLKIDKTVSQVQQILSASVAYYISNNYTWPQAIVFGTMCLDGSGTFPNCTNAYLPTNLVPPFWVGGIYYAWGGDYAVSLGLPNQSASNYYVGFLVNLKPPLSYSIATTIAGMLPLAFVSNDLLTPNSCTPTQTCYVTATITAPAQSLANATNVNYAGLYHSGACVQAPDCPPDPSNNAMVETIMVVPASVTGASDMPSNVGAANCTPTSTSACQVTAYPLNSFTAYATGPTSSVAGPPTCSNPAVTAPCTATSGGGALPAGKKYWRVCIAVATQKGFVQPTGTATQQNVWGQVSGTVMAITRCAPATESNGSNFTVWSN